MKQSSKSKKSHNLTVRTDENISKDPEPEIPDVAVQLAESERHTEQQVEGGSEHEMSEQDSEGSLKPIAITDYQCSHEDASRTERPMNSPLTLDI